MNIEVEHIKHFNLLLDAYYQVYRETKGLNWIMTVWTDKIRDTYNLIKWR